MAQTLASWLGIGPGTPNNFGMGGQQNYGGPTATQAALNTGGPNAPTAANQQLQHSDPFGGALTTKLTDAINNPSAYNSDVVQDTYGMLNRQLSEGFDVERQKIQEEMARRGLGDSTIYGGRLGDVAIQQGRAQADLAQKLLTQQAQTYGDDRASALGQGMAHSGQQFGQNLSTAQFNTGREDTGFQHAMAATNFNNNANQQNFQNQMAVQGAQSQANQQNFNNAATQYQINQGANQQNFSQYQQKLKDVLGFGQQQFQNQLNTAEFNAGQDEDMRRLLLQLLGV